MSCLSAHVDRDNPYWTEILATLRQPMRIPPAPTDKDPTDWQCGDLILTAIGPNPTAVRQWLARYLNLSPATALTLSRQPGDITIAHALNCKFALPLLAALEKRGTTAQFRPVCQENDTA